MNIKDYLKDATSKIFDVKEKQKVEFELTDHILKQKAFNEEIGYDSERAEEMAVERMGEGSEIAEQLGTLHNDFYAPVGDIICTVIWLFLLGGAYYLLKEYIFDDIAAVPITLGAICISAAIYFTASTVMLKRNKWQAAICNFVGAAGTGAWIFLSINNVNKLVSGSFDNIKNLIFNHTLCKSVTESSKAIILISVAGFALCAVICILISVIYYIKHSTANNSLFDNHFKKFAGNFTIVAALACLIISGLFAYNYFNTKSILKKEYHDYYIQVLDIAKSCKTFDEVYEYIDKLDDEYDAYVDKKGVTQKIALAKNLADISIERQQEGSYGELVISNYGFVDSGSVQDDTFYNDYSIYFSLNYEPYYKDYDHPSVKQLLTEEYILDEITRFSMEEHKPDESFDFLSDYAPRLLICKPTKNDKYPGIFEWTYLMGDTYKYQRQFHVNTYAQEYDEIINKQNEIADIIQENPEAAFDKIAELTGTELIPYPLSFEQYKDSLNMLGTFFDPIKDDILERYKQLSRFKVSDNLYFILGNTPYNAVSFISESDIKYTNIIFFDNGIFTPSEIKDTPFKKMYSSNRLLFAKNGLSYGYDTLPYFEKDGTRYTYYTVNEDPGDNSGYIKHHFLINIKGEKYEDDVCYIDSEGYLYFDTRHILKLQDDGLTYKDANGNKYTRAFETSWDKDGNIVEYKK